MKICPRCFCFQARRTYVGRPRPHIDRIIRVDHAGELGADRIYAGQMAILGKTSVGPTIQVCVRVYLCNIADCQNINSLKYKKTN